MNVLQLVRSAFRSKPRDAAAQALYDECLSKSQSYDDLSGQIMRQRLAPTAVCIDVGCCLGDELKKMMTAAPQGTFFAFEPLPHLFERLRKRFKQSNVRLSNVALSDQEGTIDFNFVETNPAYSGIRRRRYDRPHERDRTIQVPTDRLDNVLGAAGSPKVDLIKIDVEGAELLVMRGAEATLKRDRPIVIFEHGLGGTDCYDVRPEHVYDFLAGCGLSVSLMEEFLADRPPLSRDAFVDQFDAGRNFYFVAHP
ncbi:MAG TPA: FkbM family methyltransferase [Pirellulaceae bacterium]|nr:FkbM family methyltransferase [Pirellulaceae bacterium]